MIQKKIFIKNIQEKDNDIDKEKENKSLELVRVIEELEYIFFREKEGDLYKFLMTIIEKPIIESVLYKTEGNQLKAAKILGINRNTLHKKLIKLKISAKDFKTT